MLPSRRRGITEVVWAWGGGLLREALLRRSDGSRAGRPAAALSRASLPPKSSAAAAAAAATAPVPPLVDAALIDETMDDEIELEINACTAPSGFQLEPRPLTLAPGPDPGPRARPA